MSNADLADFAPKGKSGFRLESTGWIVPAVAWAFVLAILVFAVPKFEAVFRDFGIDLPSLTKLFLGASHLWPAVLGMVVVLVVADSIVRQALARREDGRGMALAWSALMIGLPMMSMVSLAIAVGLPMISFVGKLSG